MEVSRDGNNMITISIVLRFLWCAQFPGSDRQYTKVVKLDNLYMFSSFEFCVVKTKTSYFKTPFFRITFYWLSNSKFTKTNTMMDNFAPIQAFAKKNITKKSTNSIKSATEKTCLKVFNNHQRHCVPLQCNNC